MLHDFLKQNRQELVRRCRVKVAARRAPLASAAELEHGISLFLEQLADILEERQARQARSSAPSQMVSTATQHGEELLQEGFTIAQVIHDYGDLCQAITELAAETQAPITVEEFGLLNKCLDDAIAAAVTEYARRREEGFGLEGAQSTDLRLALLAHELRNLLNTAVLSFEVIKRGSVALNGSTSAVHDRALQGLRSLVDRSLAEVRLSVGPHKERVDVSPFIREVEMEAALAADSLGVRLRVPPVDSGLVVFADRQILAATLANLLHNAFKFTRENAQMDVTLRVRESDGRVCFDVEDECGGLPAGKATELMRPFEQRSSDRSGLGLGLTICQRGVEAHDGELRVSNLPGQGCVFTVDLPREPATVH